ELAGIKKAVKLAKKDYSIQFKNLSLAYDFEEAKPQVKIPECLSPAKKLLLQKEFEELNDAICRSVFCVTKKMAYEKALKIMAEVGISDGEKRFNQYPFEFSGGMRQRIVIAIAIAANPDLLICDEPTTALDVTIQAQILELINSLKKKRGMSVIFITHDLGVVANVADRIAVMYAGKIVETGSVDDVFYSPAHPYTWALLGSMPDLDSSGRLEAIPGTPPNMIYPPEGDAFAARNKYAMQIDFEMEPPLFKISESHSAATWLLHPNAPKVELPETLAKRIARMKKRRNADGGKR
ncbi:MAG: ABC transporter ATP-binding protein, partial [Treponema sp.]|nr:ABC transporter ATP-binding protein [Treponema sp.]